MNEEDIYNDLIMEHAMQSPYKTELTSCDISDMGHNPNCGDEIKLEIVLDNSKTKIEKMAFSGHGCAISQASTSIMIETLQGKTLDEAEKIIKTYIKMIQREELTSEEKASLEDAIAFENISNMPARVKCALLAWHTLENIICNQLKG